MEPTITSQPADHRNAARLGNFTSAHLGKFEPALTCTYETVVCQACSRLHFINRATGKLLGEQRRPQ
jgi:hypothetical protein